MQVDKRLLQQRQTSDPHLGGTECVHPGNQTDTFGSRVGVNTQLGDFARCFQNRLEYDLTGNGR